ncbi:hypothetical protein J2S22_001536 [Rhodoplanes tepidamans]|nr:hypothetical protein [Rhodoplanes tepidamans]
MIVLVGEVGRRMRLRRVPLRIGPVRGVRMLVMRVIMVRMIMVRMVVMRMRVIVVRVIVVRVVVVAVGVMIVVVRVAAAGGTAGAVLGAGQQRLVHDLADGAGAAAALGAAAEAAIDLAGHPRAALRHHVANLAVRQDIAGTDDHGGRDFPWRRSTNASAILK